MSTGFVNHPYPASRGPSGQNFNPQGTDPAPPPQNAPALYWYPGANSPLWSTTDVPPGSYLRGVWSTPIFDFYPQLMGLPTMQGQGQPAGRGAGAVPLWVPRGVTPVVRVQATGFSLTTWGRTGLRVLATEYASVSSTRLQQVSDPEDVSANWVGTSNSVINNFVPPGSAYPPRYWRLVLQFDYLVDSSAELLWPDPRFTIEAAIY